jgi:hypothetical protein
LALGLAVERVELGEAKGEQNKGLLKPKFEEGKAANKQRLLEPSYAELELVQQKRGRLKVRLLVSVTGRGRGIRKNLMR